MFDVIELFSGIGSQARALRNIRDDINIAGTCDWDIHAFVAYDLIHHPVCSILPKVDILSREELLERLTTKVLSGDGKVPIDKGVLSTLPLKTLKHILYAIIRNNNYVDVCSLNGCELPKKIDLMTYSFPCQDLSAVGAIHGYTKGIAKDSGSRSSLLWQVGRILSERQENNLTMPRFLLMENVTTLLNERHISNFREWISMLNKFGYRSKYFQLNASSLGLPQNRLRLLMLSVYTGDNINNDKLVKQYFSKTNDSDVVFGYRRSQFYHKKSIGDLVRIDYSDPILLQEALDCNPNDTPSRRKIWEENPQIILPGNIINKELSAVPTLTTKQDRNPNSGNIFFESNIPGRSMFRYLTPRECFLFMGFTDEDYNKLIHSGIESHQGVLLTRDKLIRMAGNSIPVQILESVFFQMSQIETKLQNVKS